LDERREVAECRNGPVGIEASEDFSFEGSDPVLDGAVVGRVIRRAVERQHALRGEEVLEVQLVEGAAVIAFEEERRTVLRKEHREPEGVLLGGLGRQDQRVEVEVGGEVTSQDHDVSGAARGGLDLAGVDGPDQVGLEPLDVEGLLTALAFVLVPCLRHLGIDSTSREGVTELGVQLAHPAGTFVAMGKPGHP